MSITIMNCASCAKVENCEKFAKGEGKINFCFKWKDRRKEDIANDVEMIYKEKTFAFNRELTKEEIRKLVDKEDLYSYHAPRINMVNGKYYEYTFFKAL